MRYSRRPEFFMIRVIFSETNVKALLTTCDHQKRFIPGEAGSKIPALSHFLSKYFIVIQNEFTTRIQI